MWRAVEAGRQLLQALWHTGGSVWESANIPASKRGDGEALCVRAGNCAGRAFLQILWKAGGWGLTPFAYGQPGLFMVSWTNQQQEVVRGWPGRQSL